MNHLKRIMCVVLSIIIVGTVLVSPEQTEAATKAEVQKSVHISSGNQIDYACDVIRVSFAKKKDYIRNVKTSSKSLIAEVTQVSRDSYNNLAEIGLYAEKKGIYTVTFDIYNSKNKKVSSHSVKVYANPETPLKSISYNGEEIDQWDYFTDVTSGKLSVDMNKGYKVKKIKVITFNQKGEMVVKSIKNNSVIQLSKYPEFSESTWENNYNMTSSGVPYTQIYITYTDKYTKNDVELEPYKIILWQ